MAEWHPVAKVEDVPEGQPVQVEAAERLLALFRLGDEFYALSDQCTHAGAPLSEGEVRGHRVRCPWHAADFDVRDGRSIGELGYNDVRSFKTRVVEGEVQVEI